MITEAVENGNSAITLNGHGTTAFAAKRRTYVGVKRVRDACAYHRSVSNRRSPSLNLRVRRPAHRRDVCRILNVDRGLWERGDPADHVDRRPLRTPVGGSFARQPSAERW